MKAWLEAGELVLHAGWLRGKTRLPLAAIDAWDFYYDADHGRYLAFHLGSQTQHVNLPRLNLAQQAGLRRRLFELTGKGQDSSLLDTERGYDQGPTRSELLEALARYWPFWPF